MNNLIKSGHHLSGSSIPLLNSGDWNSALHPRDLDGDFRYNVGRHRKIPLGTSPTQGDTILIPPHPANADVDANMRLMKLTAALNPFGKYTAFYFLVKTDGPWDYKNQPSHGSNPQYDPFGNFNYGAAGTAAGFDPHTLQIMAGRAQQPGTGGKGSLGRLGDPRSGIPPYGDRPVDNYWINQGIRYAQQKGY